MNNPGKTFFYQLVWSSAQSLFELFHQCEVYGIENIPQSDAFILASNHASFYDPPALGAHLPRELNYFARKTLFKGPLKKIITDLNSIPIDRDGDSDIAAFKKVFTVLKTGGGLLLFPEGTRTEDGHLQSAKKGVGLIACRAQVPVVPARIFGSYSAWGRHRPIPDILCPMSLVIGPPLSTEQFDPGKKDAQRYQTAADTIMKSIAQLSIPTPLTP